MQNDKDMFSLKTSKKILMICLIVLMIAILTPVVYYGLKYGLLADPDYEPDGEGRYIAITYLVEFISEFPIFSLVIVSVIVIKIIDYWLIFHNKINKTVNGLGIAVLLFWIIFVGVELWFVSNMVSSMFAHLIANVIFTSSSVKFSIVKNILFYFFTAILCIIPTLCIFICSLVLDIAGLRSETAAQRKDDNYE